jgi:hypothetical protein
MVAAVSNLPGMKGRDDLLDTIRELVADLEAGSEWENDTLLRYLDGLAALMSSIENAYVNTEQSVPENPWSILIDVFLGARFYE